MIRAHYKKYVLEFKIPSGTSRGILKTKETWFLLLTDGSKKGIGECGLFRGLSVDDKPDYENKLNWVCKNIHLGFDILVAELVEFPSIQFGVEQAFLSLKSDSKFVLFPSDFTQGKKNITINGLVWMGDKIFMKKQIQEKIEAGFSCIKMKIGAIDFETELDLLKAIRKEFSASAIELRVDANGAFSPENALEKLKQLSEFSIHSIEQPIAVNQWEKMARLCEKSPIDIALDEELIGVFFKEKKEIMLNNIKPKYIILKPSLIGGFQGSKNWIACAEKLNINWWITSALESNIGLNAIAQFTFQLKNKLPQGLGTGSLFINNFDAPLNIKNGELCYNPNQNWNLKNLENKN